MNPNVDEMLAGYNQDSDPTCIFCDGKQKTCGSFKKLVDHLKYKHGIGKKRIKGTWLYSALQPRIAMTEAEYVLVTPVPDDETSFFCQMCGSKNKKVCALRHLYKCTGTPKDVLKDWIVVKDGNKMDPRRTHDAILHFTDSWNEVQRDEDQQNQDDEVRAAELEQVMNGRDDNASEDEYEGMQELENSSDEEDLPAVLVNPEHDSDDEDEVDEDNYFANMRRYARQIASGSQSSGPSSSSSSAQNAMGQALMDTLAAMRSEQQVLREHVSKAPFSKTINSQKQSQININAYSLVEVSVAVPCLLPGTSRTCKQRTIQTCKLHNIVKL